MRLSIGIPIINQKEATQRALNSLKNTQEHDNEYILLDNGSDEPLRDWIIGLTGDDKVIRNNSNVGLPKALNTIMKVATGDYILFTHNDIEMFEKGWDTKVMKAIEEAGNVGVAGFYGAMGIGTGDIYNTPYVMNQLVRTHPIAGTRCRQDPKIHGHMQFSQDWIKVAVLDGFSLIVKNDGVLKFDTTFGPHHMYDNDICLQAYANYKQVICINMDIIHYGGMTDVRENWAEPFGKTKQQVHQEAHPPFYNKWRNGTGPADVRLPFRV